METSLGNRKHEGAVAFSKAQKLGLAPERDEAVRLGVLLAGLVEAGTDKLMLSLSPGLSALEPEAVLVSVPQDPAQEI